MAKLVMKVSAKPCGHWLEIEGEVMYYNVVFRVPDFCPRCGTYYILIDKVHDVEYIDDPLDSLAATWSS